MHNEQGCVSNDWGHRKWFEILKEAHNLLKNLESLSYKNTKLKWLKLDNAREFHFEVYLSS